MIAYVDNSIDNGELFMGTIKEIRQYKEDMDNRIEETRSLISSDIEANQKLKEEAEAATEAATEAAAEEAAPAEEAKTEE